MKNIYLLSTLLVLSLSSFAKTYYIYTAKQSGSWNKSQTWNMIVRNDNVNKDKVIIPSAYTITADNDVNNLGFTDVELQISGVLEMDVNTTLYFGANSRIEILSTGSIEGSRSTQQIFIGSVSKYIGNRNKTLSGTVYADNSTGAAPYGFSTYTVLSINTNPAFVPVRPNTSDKSPIIYSINKNISITFKSEVRAAVEVKVINMNGSVVSSESFNNPSLKLTLDMSNVKSGIYVVSVTGSNYTTTVKKIFIN